MILKRMNTLLNNKILLIDKNQAIRAITSLTLNALDLEVIVFDEKLTFYQNVKKVNPALIICSYKEDNPEESLSFCKEIRNDKEFKDTIFLLTVKDEITKSLTIEAIKAGVTEILKKPFKSEQLKNIIEDLLEISENPKKDNENVLLVSKNELTQKILEKILTKHQINLYPAESINEASFSLSKHKFYTLIIDISKTEDEKESLKLILKHKEELNSIILITKKEVSFNVDFKNLKIIKRPLSFSKLKESIKILDSKENLLPQENTPLTTEELSILAAKISSSIFEILLTQQSLKSKDWNMAANTIKSEAIRICSQFDALSKLRK